LNTDLFSQFRIVLKNESLSDVFWLAWYKNGIKSQSGFKPTPGISDTLFHAYTVDLDSNKNWTGTIDYFHVEIANKVDSGLVTIDSIEFIPRAGVVQQNVNITIDGNGWVNPASGTCFTGQEVEFSAFPAEGFQFAGWAGDVNSSDNPLTISVNSDLNLRAQFELIPSTYNLNISAENGTVEILPEQEVYEEGTSISLTAVPDVGYIFESWGGDTTDSINPLTITIDGDKNITAHFILETTHIEEPLSLVNCVAYPVPADEHLNLMNIPNGASISIANLEGKEIKRMRVNENNASIEVMDMEPGIYLLSVKTNSECVFMKVIIN